MGGDAGVVQLVRPLTLGFGLGFDFRIEVEPGVDFMFSSEFA